MPRYFFHVEDSIERIDEDGVELRDVEDARAQAVIGAGEALRDLDGRFWSSPGWRMWVTDESGETVCSLNFSGR